MWSTNFGMPWRLKLYYQNAYTTIDAQYSHDSNAYIQAYQDRSWQMTQTIYGDVNGNKLSGTHTYTHGFGFSYGAQGQTTWVQWEYRYEKRQDGHSGSYSIFPLSDLNTYYIHSMGSWDYMSAPAQGAPNTVQVVMSPGEPPSTSFHEKTDSSLMLQLQVGVNMFGIELNVGIRESSSSSCTNQVQITFTYSGTTTATWRICLEDVQESNGAYYGYCPHVWRIS